MGKGTYSHLPVLAKAWPLSTKIDKETPELYVLDHMPAPCPCALLTEFELFEKISINWVSKHLLLTVLRTGKTKINTPTDIEPGESSCPGLQMAVSFLYPHMVGSREKSQTLLHFLISYLSLSWGFLSSCSDHSQSS